MHEQRPFHRERISWGSIGMRNLSVPYSTDRTRQRVCRTQVGISSAVSSSVRSLSLPAVLSCLMRSTPIGNGLIPDCAMMRSSVSQRRSLRWASGRCANASVYSSPSPDSARGSHPASLQSTHGYLSADVHRPADHATRGAVDDAGTATPSIAEAACLISVAGTSAAWKQRPRTVHGLDARASTSCAVASFWARR